MRLRGLGGSMFDIFEPPYLLPQVLEPCFDEVT